MQKINFLTIAAVIILLAAAVTSCGDAKSGNSVTLITVADELRFGISGTGTATILWGNQKVTAELSEDVRELVILDILDSNSQKVTISGNVTLFDCEWGELTALDVSRNSALEILRISFSDYLRNLDLSKNSALTYVDISTNEFSAEALNELFGSLHSNGGTINIFGNPGTDHCNKSIAEAKGWKVQTTEYGDWGEQTEDDQLSQLMPEIIYKMPTQHMPDFLKTEEQRRQAVSSFLGEYGENKMTAFSLYNHHDYGYDMWTIAGYLTENNQNVLLIVQFGTGLDGFQLKSDKTLNYSIETQEFTEIVRPIEMPTVDEMVLESLIENTNLFQKAKTHFGNKMEFNYGNFYKEGFSVGLNYFEFWLKNDNFDYYHQKNVRAWYKWDGKKFYKYAMPNDTKEVEIDDSWYGKYECYISNVTYTLDIKSDGCIFTGDGLQTYFVENCTVKKIAHDMLLVRFHSRLDGFSINEQKPYVIKLFQKDYSYYFNSPSIFGEENTNTNVFVEIEKK